LRGMRQYGPEGKYVQSVGIPLGCCLGLSMRWTDEPRRPPFERHPARGRDAVAHAAHRLTDDLAPRSGKPCPDEASDCVAIDPVDDYKHFLGSAVRTVGEQF
jgi:hypothetical protein